MAYSAQPTTRSGAPGSLWWLTTDGANTRVWATQWDALLRRFQNVAQRLVPPVYAFPPDGNCTRVASYIGSNPRRRDAITVDGVFGPESRDLLGYLLCSAGESDRARRLATETASHIVSEDTMRELAMFATLVSAVGTPGAPSLSISPQAASLSFSGDLVLPTWLQRVASAPEDELWLASWVPDAGEAAPIAPSQRDPNMVPAPTPAPTPGGGAMDTGGSTPGSGTVSTTDTTTTTAGDATPVYIGLALAVGAGVLILATGGKKRSKSHG
jgi:hypothetical protein